MGLRSREQAAGPYGASVAARRGAYSDLNIDPYAGRRIKAGRRQEDWQDILAHGERSDTDWSKTFQENALQLRRSYSPKGDWAKISDATDKSLYNVVWGRSVNLRAPHGGDEPATPEAVAQYAAANIGRAKAFEGERRTDAAKWMAAYNKNLNIHERISLSEKRTRYRERFAAMQITRERTQSKKTRATLKRGATGLSVSFGAGAGTGLGISI